ASMSASRSPTSSSSKEALRVVSVFAVSAAALGLRPRFLGSAATASTAVSASLALEEARALVAFFSLTSASAVFTPVLAAFFAVMRFLERDSLNERRTGAHPATAQDGPRRTLHYRAREGACKRRCLSN